MKHRVIVLTTLGVVVLLGTLGLVRPSSAQAGGVHISIGLPVPFPVVVVPPPVVVRPWPVVVRPWPVVVAPAPVVIHRPPAYIERRVVYDHWGRPGCRTPYTRHGRYRY